MKIIIIISVFIILSINPNDIAKINKLKKEAEKYFHEKNYNSAIKKYEYLIDSMKIEDDNMLLNLSHSYLLSGDTAKAIEGYNIASSSKINKLKSIALQQLGVISNNYNKLDESSELFKNSIKADPLNVESKYNYELIMKRIKEQQNNEQQNKEQQNKEQQNKEQQNKEQQNKEQQNKEQQNKEQQNKEQQNKEQQNKEQQNKEQQNKEQQNKEQQKRNNKIEKSIEEKLKEINISKEKAEMILEALRNNEFQYLQQLKRKSSKKVDKSKPDW